MSNSGTRLVALPFAGDTLQMIVKDNNEGFLSINTPCRRLGLSYEQASRYIKDRFPGFWKEEGDALYLSSQRIVHWLITIQPDQCASARQREVLKLYQTGLDHAIEAFLRGQTQPVAPVDPLDVLEAMVHQLRDQGQRLTLVEKSAQRALHIANKALEDGDRDPDTRTILAFMKRWKLSLNEWEASALGNAASAECRRRGIPLGKAPDCRFDTVNTYPIPFLQEFFTRKFGPQPVR